MKHPVRNMMITAAVSGLLGGTAARLQAAPAPASHSGITSTTTSSLSAVAGKVSIAKAAMLDGDKHSCKGKNDCKGQGGCKSSANGCKGKNDCKGQGGCATDGSKKHLNA
jgi:hypothetical protein